MITCNYCGYKVPDGAHNCPKCGTPFSTRMESGSGSRIGGQDQPEIPAWLETLRVGERPAAPANNSTNFSAADLIEDGALPSWMRSERPQASSSSVSDAFNALHPVSGPSSVADQGPMPQRSLDAHSLIDEKSLPTWIREGSPSTPASGFEASSLIDSNALPDWMRSLQPPQSSTPGPQPVQPTPDPAPDWMRSLQPPQASPSSTPSAQPSFSAAPRSEPAAPSSTGFSVRELLDEQALPAWMTQQNGQTAIPNNGQPGALSPSSLIDQNALPDWMREGGNVSPRVPSPPVQSSPSWQAPQAPAQAPLAQNPAGPNSGLVASSFIDTNSLPEWLRSAAAQPPSAAAAPPQPEPSRANAYAAPPRVENMRVPSRPRGEVNPNDGSEEAANVFASMLGVASSTPQLPTSSPYGQQRPNPYPSPQGLPQAQTPAMGMPGQMPTYNGAGMAQQGPVPNTAAGMNQPGYASGSYGIGYAGTSVDRSSLGVPSSGAMPPQSPYSGAFSSKPNGSGQADDQKAPKKRGLVDTLLGWLLH